jgi:hypothetical protein
MHPLLQKLNLDTKNPVLLMSAPDHIKRLFAELVEVHEHHDPQRKYPFVLAFVQNLEQASHIAGNLVSAYLHGGYLWVAYPRGTSHEFVSEISGDSLWGVLAPYDLEPVHKVALQDDWCAIQFRHVDEIKAMIKKTATPEKSPEENEVKKIENVEDVISHGDVLP